MSDAAALKAMLEFEYYAKYSAVLFKLKNLQAETSMILKTIQRYHDKYRNENSISVDELEIFFHNENPALMNSDSYKRMFQQIKETEIQNKGVVKDLLNGLVERHICTEIYELAIDVAQGEASKGIDKISKKVEEYGILVGGLEDSDAMAWRIPTRKDLEEMDKEGLELPLPFLQEVFGPLPVQTLGHIFARPDGGKTSMALNYLVHFAKNNKDSKVLYLSNEEGVARIGLRILSVFSGIDAEMVKKKIEVIEKKYNEIIGDSIRLFGGVTYIYDIERLLREYKPIAAIIDQGPKVYIPMRGDGNEVARLQRLYNYYRELAKNYNTRIITLGQADVESSNKSILGLHNLSGSKVGIPGELDWCLAIGHKEGEQYQETRWLNAAKNKITGRRGNSQVHFDPFTGRFRGIVKSRKE